MFTPTTLPPFEADLKAHREALVVDTFGRLVDFGDKFGDRFRKGGIALQRFRRLAHLKRQGRVVVDQLPGAGIEFAVDDEGRHLEHRFDVTDVFGDRTFFELLQAFLEIRVRDRAEVAEGLEEQAVRRRVQGAVVAEVLVRPALGKLAPGVVVCIDFGAGEAVALLGRLGALGGDGRLVGFDAVGLLVDAQALAVEEVEVLLHIERARVMVVQVAALGHLREEHGQLGQLRVGACDQGRVMTGGGRFVGLAGGGGGLLGHGGGCDCQSDQQAAECVLHGGLS
jgi:hypothetical protein